jgi:nucleotide-binding universal stress UspA family protein
MFEKILVPVDFSERARSAFGHGALFAEAFGGELELTHVVEDVVLSQPSFWSGEAALAAELHRQGLVDAELAMQSLVSTLSLATSLRVSTSVLSGPLPGALLDYAKASGTSLLVVSTHGRTGFSRWLMGSVSERLLRSSPCPVLVARGGTEAAHPELRRLLVAVDLSPHSRRALEMAGRVAQTLGASLEVLYVWAAPYYGEAAQTQTGLFERIRESARTELDEFITQSQLAADVPLTRTILSGTAGAKIGEHVQATLPDLLVLGTHGHGGFKRMILGSVAEATTRYASCATLVVP